MSKRCPGCEVQVPEKAKFCSNCGHFVSQEVRQKVHMHQGQSFLDNLQQANRAQFRTTTFLSANSPTLLEMGSGLAAMLVGILTAAAVLLVVLDAQDFGYFLKPGFTLGTLLLALTLPGLQTRQAGRLGWLGQVGFILGMIGIVTFTVLFPSRAC